MLKPSCISLYQSFCFLNSLLEELYIWYVWTVKSKLWYDLAYNTDASVNYEFLYFSFCLWYWWWWPLQWTHLFFPFLGVMSLCPHKKTIIVKVIYLVKLKFRIVDLTNPWGPHFTVQVANFPFNLISCFLTEFLKRWQFSGFTAHCFTDKHAIHNAFRSSGIPKSAKLSEPRFGRDTSHPETELGQKSTVCQGLLCPSFHWVQGESVGGGKWEDWSQYCCHPSSRRSACQKDKIKNKLLIFLYRSNDV